MEINKRFNVSATYKIKLRFNNYLDLKKNEIKIFNFSVINVNDLNFGDKVKLSIDISKN